MISKLFIMIVLFSVVSAIAADDSIPPILQCERFLKKGVYMTFEEFLNNNPSKKGVFAKHGNSLKYLGKRGKTRTYTGKMWGYTGGQTVYVKHDSSLMPLTLFRYYSIISEREAFTLGSKGPTWSKTGHGPMKTITYNTPIEIKYTKKFVLDMKNGKIEKLTQDVLKKIIADDNELMKRFEAKEDKKGTLPFYVVEYNKRKDSTNVADTLNTVK